ncbi:MAG: 50S ribosomal protein L29 [Armatimonadetes bacterium]|jgi:large subunit ribosomal protein L29|nr:50S ribosomal protein L29 [Armatimonadota bacterium]
MAEEKIRAKLERLRNLSDQELVDELRKQRERLFQLRRRNVTRQLDNVSSIPETKRDIARILTLQTERAIAGGGE